MRSPILVILILVILGSCNPAKRIQRICNRNPELCKPDTITWRDTIKLTDTLRIPETKTSGSFTDPGSSRPGDTLLNKTEGSLNITVIKGSGDSYQVTATDKARDTIRILKKPIIIKIPGKNILLEPRFYKLYKYTFFGLLGALLVIVLIRISRSLFFAYLKNH